MTDPSPGDPVVSLSHVAEELTARFGELRSFLSRRTGEVLHFEPGAFAAAEEGRLDATLEHGGREEIEAAVRILEAPQDWVELPGEDDFDEWRVMERFARALDDEPLRRELLDAISGRGAFRFFRSVVRRVVREREWFDFRDGAFGEHVADWLRAEGVAYRE